MIAGIVKIGSLRDALLSRIRWQGEDLYRALGHSDSGRYLTVFFIYKKTREALVISARDMTQKEKRQYEKRKR